MPAIYRVAIPALFFGAYGSAQEIFEQFATVFPEGREASMEALGGAIFVCRPGAAFLAVAGLFNEVGLRVERIIPAEEIAADLAAQRARAA